MNRLWEWFEQQVLFYEGSTRTAGLLRILLALLMWARWGTAVAPFTNATPERLLLGVSFYISTTLMLFGVSSRFSTAWAGGTALVMAFGFGNNGVEAWAHHHTTLLALSVAMCALTPCGHSYSYDRWLAVRRSDVPPTERAPLWGMRLIGFHVSVVYFWTAWDKTFWGFLSGERMEMAFHTLYLGSDFAEFPGFGEALMVISIMTVTLEYALAFLLWVPRWQWWTFPVGFALHAIIYITLPVATFTVTMYALYLAYLDPDQFHDWIDRISGHEPAAVNS